MRLSWRFMGQLLFCNYLCSRFPDHENVRQSYGITKINLKASVPLPKYNETDRVFDKVYYPVTLDTTILPLGVKNYQFLRSQSASNPEVQILNMILTEAEYPNLLTFGFFGRVFEKDGRPATGGTSLVYSSWLIISLATLLSILIAFVDRV